MKTGVYKITNTINGKLYIGSAAGKGFSNRWNKHVKDLNRQRHYNVKLQRAWDKYGEEVFSFEILEECAPEFCIEREQYYLDTLLFASHNDKRFNKLGYNIQRSVRRTNLGRKFSYAFKEKIRKARLGKKASSETKKKMSAAHKGNQYALGYKHTKETKKQISQTMQGNKNPFYGKSHSKKTKEYLSQNYSGWINGEKCHKAKLSQNDVRQIRKRINNKETTASILKDYPYISRYTLYDIKHYRSWKHLDAS